MYYDWLQKKIKKISCNMPWCKYSFHKRHNKSITSEYRIWTWIKQRCYNKLNPSYPYYWWIWIIMDNNFREDFEEFYKEIWPRPSKLYSVDRIDVLKWYVKWNIKWSTKKEQSNNVRKVNSLTLEIQRLKSILDSNKIIY